MKYVLNPNMPPQENIAIMLCAIANELNNIDSDLDNVYNAIVAHQ